MVWGLVNGVDRPNKAENYFEVNFSNSSPPITIPRYSAYDWIMLASSAEEISLTMRECKAMFWTTMQTCKSRHNPAKKVAYFRSV